MALAEVEGIECIEPGIVFKYQTGYAGCYDDLGLKDEYDKLRDINDRLDDENCVSVYNFIEEGDKAGYTMEELDIEYLLHEPSISEDKQTLAKVTRELVDVIHCLHHGSKWPTYHGELYHNIAVVDADDGFKPCLIDPAGKTRDRFEKSEQKNSDFMNLQLLAKEHLGDTQIIEEMFPLQAYDRFAQPDVLAD